MKYFVESYGCTMNYGEGEELLLWTVAAMEGVS